MDVGQLQAAELGDLGAGEVGAEAQGDDFAGALQPHDDLASQLDQALDDRQGGRLAHVAYAGSCS